jgi:hypothetical protein
MGTRRTLEIDMLDAKGNTVKVHIIQDDDERWYYSYPLHENPHGGSVGPCLHTIFFETREEAEADARADLDSRTQADRNEEE